jgi:hypothetical protein
MGMPLLPRGLEIPEVVCLSRQLTLFAERCIVEQVNDVIEHSSVDAAVFCESSGFETAYCDLKEGSRDGSGVLICEESVYLCKNPQ